MQLAGTQRDPPVDAAQPVAGREHAHAGQLATLAGAPRPVHADQAGRARHRVFGGERVGDREHRDPPGLTGTRVADEQAVRGHRVGHRRAERRPAPAHRLRAQLQIGRGTGRHRGHVGAVAVGYHQPGRDRGAQHHQVVPDLVRVGDGQPGRYPARLADEVRSHVDTDQRYPRRPPPDAQRRAERERRRQYHQIHAAQQHRGGEQYPDDQHRPAEGRRRRPAPQRVLQVAGAGPVTGRRRAQRDHGQTRGRYGSALVRGAGAAPPASSP